MEKLDCGEAKEKSKREEKSAYQGTSSLAL